MISRTATARPAHFRSFARLATFVRFAAIVTSPLLAGLAALAMTTVTRTDIKIVKQFAITKRHGHAIRSFGRQ